MSIRPLIWHIDDGGGGIAWLHSLLAHAPFDLRGVNSSNDFIQRLARGRPALLIASTDGDSDSVLKLCHTIRAAHDDTPILLIDRSNSIELRIAALEAGADDCLGSPLQPRELLAHIQALLRRRIPATPRIDGGRILFGDCSVDLDTRGVMRNGEAVALTSAEFALLATLLRHPKLPLTRERIDEMTRGNGDGSRGIDVRMSRLRRLLERDPTRPRFLQTVWGYGYIFVPDGEPATAAAESLR